MIGLFIELIVSWLLLRLVEKKGLSALGLQPDRKRLGELAAGLLLTIPFSAAFYLGVSFLVHNPYQLNPHYSIKDAVVSLAYLFRSVAYEELMFRGALLYILINRIGATRAVFASGAAFGIYHWFSYGVLGQPVQMLVVFVTTGLAGYIMAVAFQRTRSMYLAFGLHFGVDLVPMLLFSKDHSKIGQQLLVQSFANAPYNPGSVVSILVYIVYFAWFPLLSFWYLGRGRNSHKLSKNDS